MATLIGIDGIFNVEIPPPRRLVMADAVWEIKDADRVEENRETMKSIKAHPLGESWRG
jgi:hypothetical protein